MWISKAEYKTLKETATNHKHDAEEFHRLIENIKEKQIIRYYSNFMLISRDVWDEIMEAYNSFAKDKRDIQAELEWYKIKYHEMKINTEWQKRNFKR